MITPGISVAIKLNLLINKNSPLLFFHSAAGPSAWNKPSIEYHKTAPRSRYPAHAGFQRPRAAKRGARTTGLPVRAPPFVHSLIPPGRNIPPGPHKRRPPGTPDAHAFPWRSRRQLAHRAQCVAHGHGVALFHSDVRKAAYAYRQLSGVQLHNAAPLGVLISAGHHSAGGRRYGRRPPRRPGPCRCGCASPSWCR